MKKIIIFVAVVVVLLVAYLLISNNTKFNQEGNQANVISNLFSKDNKSVTTQADSGKITPTSTGKRAPTPTVERFKSNDMSKMKEIYIDGLKKKNPRTEVPR